LGFIIWLADNLIEVYPDHEHEVRNKMIRFLLKLILCLLIALAAGFGYLAVRSGDPLYSFYEWVSPARFQQYDKLILSIAAEHQLDPMLVKAVVWRESRFERQKYGSAGERGLMQVSEKAANEWAHEHKIDNFHIEQLFDPKTNLEAGSWYLRRALDRWQNQTDPLPFALAEYNAGASRVQRWVGTDGATTSQFLENIDFPTTRNYIESILNRYAFYKKRGRM
jgi:soluble lytic murein transglycosylase